MSSDERDRVVEALGEAIRAYQNALDKADDAVAEILGINRTDARALDIVDQHGRITAGQLAVEAGLTTGAVTAVIDRLERAGLIRRVRDAEDRRKVWLEVTPAASEAMGELFAPMLAEANRAMERYSTRELARITDFVQMAGELTDAHIDRLRGRMDKQIDATVRKVQNKMAAKQRKLAGIPNRVAAKLDAKQAKLERKLERKLGARPPE
jgi:DNA-binding MarR family transcriptional regulator